MIIFFMKQGECYHWPNPLALLVFGQCLFCLKKKYKWFGGERGKKFYFFPCTVEILFLLTKGCGNSIPIILIIKILIYS